MSEQQKTPLRAAVAYARWRLKGRPMTHTSVKVSVDDWAAAFGDLGPPVPGEGDPLAIIMICDDPSAAGLESSITSLCAQSDDSWSLDLVLPPSTSSASSATLLDLEREESRITVHRGGPGEVSIFRDVDSIVESTSGSHVLLLFGNVQLGSGAVAWFRANIADADLIYADEIVTVDGDRHPIFKPAWSPTLATTTDYLGPAFVIRRSLYRDLGGLRRGYRDLCQRLASSDAVVCHLPNLLVETDHGLSMDSTIGNVSAIGGGGGDASVPERPDGGLAVHWNGDDVRTVKVVIPTRDHLELLRRAVDSVLSATGVPELTIVIVDNGSRDGATLDYLADITATDARVAVAVDDEPFNFSRVCNRGARFGDVADVIVFLNNDVSSADPGWLRQMVGWFGDPRVGAVGARLDFPDGRIQHMGVVVGRDQFLGDEIPDGYVPLAAHVGHGLQPAQVAGSLFDSQREVGALTAACLAVRGETFAAIGGFDESLAIDFQDVDLCLRIVAQRRLSLIYDATVVLEHQESASRGSVGASAPETLALMTERWGEVLQSGDPFYSPHLALDLTLRSVRELDPSDLRLRISPRVSSEMFRER